MVGNVSLMLACNELIGLVGPSHVSLISANQSSAQTIRSRATDMADARRCVECTRRGGKSCAAIESEPRGYASHSHGFVVGSVVAELGLDLSKLLANQY